MAERLQGLWAMVDLFTRSFLVTFICWLLFLGVPMFLASVAMLLLVLVLILVFDAPMPGKDTFIVLWTACFLGTGALLLHLAIRKSLIERARSWVGLPAVCRPTREKLPKRKWWSWRELLPHIYLKWREPKLVRHAVARLEKKLPWGQPAAIVTGFMTGGLLWVWLLAWLDWKLTGKNEPMRPVLVVPFAMASGLFLYLVGQLLWQVAELFPSVIKVTQVSIFRSSAYGAAWRYERVARCEIFSKEFEGFAARVLSMEMHDGSRHLVGIADAVPLEDLQRVLSERGVETTVHG